MKKLSCLALLIMGIFLAVSTGVALAGWGHGSASSSSPELATEYQEEGAVETGEVRESEPMESSEYSAPESFESTEYQSEEPAETGTLPSLDPGSFRNDPHSFDQAVDVGGKLIRPGIDDGGN